MVCAGPCVHVVRSGRWLQSVCVVEHRQALPLHLYVRFEFIFDHCIFKNASFLLAFPQFPHSVTPPQYFQWGSCSSCYLSSRRVEDALVTKAPTSHLADLVLIWQQVVEFGQRLGINPMPAITHWLLWQCACSILWGKSGTVSWLDHVVSVCLTWWDATSFGSKWQPAFCLLVKS